MGLDPLTAGRAIGAIISSALQGEGADTAAQRAALETSLLHALTWLTPPDTTIEMTRAVTLDALRHVAAPRARLRAAWERVGRRQSRVRSGTGAPDVSWARPNGRARGTARPRLTPQSDASLLLRGQALEEIRRPRRA
jgi:hypothetical protein